MIAFLVENRQKRKGLLFRQKINDHTFYYPSQKKRIKRVRVLWADYIKGSREETWVPISQLKILKPIG